MVGGAAGELVIKQPLIASMRVVKKETLKLISCWVTNSQDAVMVQKLLHIFYTYILLSFILTTGQGTFSTSSIGCHFIGLQAKCFISP